MTDLPQLQTLLVDAAVKQRRRRRVKRAAAPVLALAVLLALVPWVVGDLRTPDTEEPVATPSPVPSVDVAATFGVFRRAATPEDHAERSIDARHLWGDAYLTAKGDRVCLVVITQSSCGRIADLRSARRVLALSVDDRGYAAFPDGIRTAALKTQDGTSRDFAVIDNYTGFHDRGGGVELSWTALDGTPARRYFGKTTQIAPAAFYGVLDRRETSGDRVAGLPGARLMLQSGGDRMWLAPHENEICVVLQVGATSKSGCKGPASDRSAPLAVALDGRVAVAVPDGARVATEPPSGGYTGNAALLPRGTHKLRYTDPGDKTITIDLPAGDTYVYDGR